MSFILNPDKGHVAFIRRGLEKKGGYCPCRVQKVSENICPCVEFLETGHCRCQLFIKKVCDCKGGN